MGERVGSKECAARTERRDPRSTTLPSALLGTGRAGLRFGRDDRRGNAGRGKAWGRRQAPAQRETATAGGHSPRAHTRPTRAACGGWAGPFGYAQGKLQNASPIGRRRPKQREHARGRKGGILRFAQDDKRGARGGAIGRRLVTVDVVRVLPRTSRAGDTWVTLWYTLRREQMFGGASHNTSYYG